MIIKRTLAFSIRGVRRGRWAVVGALLAVVALASTADAQHEGHDMSKMAAMPAMLTSPLGISMNRMGSGTSWIPDAVPVSTYQAMAGKWDIMAHGNLFIQYDKQGGRRGSDQFGALNWAMLMASHAVGDSGLFQARTMLSLEPATVTSKGYPLLLQTGESRAGIPLHDRQHPHDFWMELGALVQLPLARGAAMELYAAPVGEPALGPPAYMHRPSAMDNPIAPISHHWQDATHITFGVVTAGIFTKRVKLEGSVFNGREPDEHRWGFDRLRLNSYSTRLTVNPDSQWSLTASYGFLKTPEVAEPDESIHRISASAMRAARFGKSGTWSTSAVWGANVGSGSHGWTNSALLETDISLDGWNTIVARFDVTRKSAHELVLPPAAFAEDRRFDVGSLSAGYIRELAQRFGMTAGIGVLGTLNRVPGALESTYGTAWPKGGIVFLRLRPKSGAAAQH